MAVFAALYPAMRYTSFGLQMRAVVAEPAHGGFDGHPHQVGRRAHLRARAQASPALPGLRCRRLTTSAPTWARLYRRQLHGRGVRRRRQPLGHAGRRDSRLGVANKFLEPWAGAVLAKILVLVFIILFIQKRPRGLFPQKGRAAEGMIDHHAPRAHPQRAIVAARSSC
jgi:urea transport system permease protein